MSDNKASSDDEWFEGEEIAGYLPEVSYNLLEGTDEFGEKFEDAEEGDEEFDPPEGLAGPDPSRSKLVPPKLGPLLAALHILVVSFFLSRWMRFVMIWDVMPSGSPI